MSHAQPKPIKTLPTETTLRGPIARGLAATGKASATEGDYSAGIIRGMAVVTRGEALGHFMWLDHEFVRQVDAALAAGSKKSRFAHPSLSGDGIGKALGRVHRAEGDAETARGDLHFFRSASRAPDGNLSAYVLELAAEDSTCFGASIAFDRDVEAEAAFMLEHGAEWVDDPYWGRSLDLENFRSPDPDNVNHLPHARLAALNAVDVVDDPAANPSGLFHRDDKLKAAESLADFALGLGDAVAPATASQFSAVEPERLRAFVSRYLQTRGLTLTQQATPPADVSPETTPATEPVTAVEPDSTDPAASVDPKASARADLNRYVKRFGAELGGTWFAEEIDYATACERFIDLQAEQLATATKARDDAQAALATFKQSIDRGEGAPLSFRAEGDQKPDGDQAAKLGDNRARIASAIKLPQASRN